MYKLVIPTAGVGSRSGCKVNKALTTVGDLPMITHVINKFPNAARIIVILGYQGSYVRQALEAIYGPGKIIFVTVNDYNRGLGWTLRAAEDHLQCPFIFAANDGYVTDTVDIDPDEMGNWAGCHNLSYGADITEYRTAVISNGYVTDIQPKGLNHGTVYVGIAGIRDYKTFWDAMRNDAAITAGEAYGLKALSPVRSLAVLHWRDGGAAGSLADLKASVPSAYNHLEKPDEFLWFFNGRVIKFSTNETFISNRVQRTAWMDHELIPETRQVGPNVYTYPYCEGRILSEVIDGDVTTRLLDTMLQRVWSQRSPLFATEQNYRLFYHSKTYTRLNLFFSRFECVDQPNVINGLRTPSVHELLQRVDWSHVCRSSWVAHFHGDFHNENILVRPDETFCLLDWRQDFGGDLTYGDVYYDLAKFAHGLLVSHAAVARDHFFVKYQGDGSIEIDIERPERLLVAERAFDAWLRRNKVDLKRVRLLTALIFLNICGLHHHPYSMFLHYFGKRMLAKELA